MELKEQSDLIKLELDTVNGATSPILYYHKGYLTSEGNKARWFAAQVTADNRLTIYRKTDFKAESITSSSKIFQFQLATAVLKTGTMNYVNRMSTNLHCNIIQQTAPTRQWVFYQVDWVGDTITKNLILDIQPDSSSTIDYLTRYNNHLYLKVIDTSLNWWIYYIDLSNHAKIGTVSSATATLSVTKDETNFCAGEDYLYVIESGDLKIFEHGNLVSPDYTESSVISDTDVEIREIDTWDIFVRASGSTLYRIEFDGSVAEVSTISTALETDTENFRVLTRGEIYVEAVDITRTVNVADEHFDNWYIIGETEEINADLGAIVDEICTDVGISSVEVTSLIDTVIQGYKISNYAISDSFMKELMVAYQFDRVESGGNLKFIKRGGTSSQTLDVDRLGAIISGNSVGNSFPERISRTLETSRLVPREFKIIYLEQQKDYDQTEQSIIRQDAQNRDQQVLDMSAFAWTDSIARQIADKSISLFFTEREQFILYVSAYYYNIEPTDINTVEIDSENNEIRITETSYTYPGIMQIQGVLENINDYSSEIVGVAGDTDAQSFPNFSEYETIILDINVLFDNDANDNSSGNYAVARTIGSSFNSPQIVRSAQGANQWTVVGSIENEAIIGNCTTELGDGTVDIIDIKNSVQVQISPSSTLSSISESDLLDENNMCVIGNNTSGFEVVYFQNAVEIGSGDGIWQLDTFIRGGKGTEHLTDSHSIGDIFVLIELDKISNLEDTNDNIGNTSDYIGIDQGNSVAEDADDDDTYRSNLVNRRGLPFSVAHENATKDSGTSNITITWIRRARYSGEWEDFVDVPETEITESYEVDIIYENNVIRTLTSSTNSVVYTSSQQTFDFGSSINSLDCKIYKVHPSFGRGYEKELNVTF